MDEKDVFLEIFIQLKESKHHKFMSNRSEFENILNLPINDISTYIDLILNPQYIINKNSESNREIDSNKIQSITSNDKNKGEKEFDPFTKSLVYTPSDKKEQKESQNSKKDSFQKESTHHKLRSQISSTSRKEIPPTSLSQISTSNHQKSGKDKQANKIRTTPNDIDTTLPPSSFSIGESEPVDISNKKQVIIVKKTIRKYSGYTKEFFERAEKELKNLYSGTSNKVSVPCQICRYYCRECELKGDVIENFSCLSTCKLLFFNHSGDLSCSKFTLWDKKDFEEKRLTHINKDFFLGYMLILCHNHRIAFTQGRKSEIKKNIREQLYRKAVDEDYLENLENAVIIKIKGMINSEGEAIPMGIYISKEHLEFFKETYKLMNN
ncbi:MAG: hypothetical protein ACTSRP_01595 [Candidatus Helarchaeota archaeon]